MGSRDAQRGHTCDPPRRDRDNGRETAHDRAAGQAHGGAISTTRRPRHGLRRALHGAARLHAAAWTLGRKRTGHSDHVRVMAGAAAPPRGSRPKRRPPVSGPLWAGPRRPHATVVGARDGRRGWEETGTAPTL